MLPIYIAFFVLSAISIFCSTSVLISLFRLGSSKSCFTFLLYWFHASMIGQELTVLPLVYNKSRDSCVAMEFLHYFFGLMNIIIVAMLVEAHRSTLLTDFFSSRKKILQYGSYILIFFPFITAIPFAVSEFTINYGDDDSGWCVLPYNSASTWIIGVYYFWIWFFLLGSIASMLYSGYYVCKSDRMLAQKFMSTIGIYVIVAILSWLPRSFERISLVNNEASRSTYLVAFLPISISGILYSLIYIRERRSLWQFQESAGEEQMSSVSFSFTWEKEDFPDELISAMGSDGGVNNTFSTNNRSRSSTIQQQQRNSNSQAFTNNSNNNSQSFFPRQPSLSSQGSLDNTPSSPTSRSSWLGLTTSGGRNSLGHNGGNNSNYNNSSLASTEGVRMNTVISNVATTTTDDTTSAPSVSTNHKKDFVVTTTRSPFLTESLLGDNPSTNLSDSV